MYSKAKPIFLLFIGILIGAGLGFIVTTDHLRQKLESHEMQISALTSEVSTQSFLIGFLEQENEEYRTQITSFENEIVVMQNVASYYETQYYNLLEEYEALQQSTRVSDNGYNITVLANQEYYHAMKEDLRNAENSIIVAMYSMIYDPGDTDDWANDLIEELVYAKNRGVDILVLLEYRTYFGYQDENWDTYTFLTENGVDVLLDYEDDTDHLKSVIIDTDIWYVGSHNWSESGLFYNREVSVRINGYLGVG